MGKLIAAALVSVIAIEPIRFNGEKYAPGSTITGLTQKQADQLVDGNHAELVTEDGDQGGDQGGGDGEASGPAAAAKQAAAPAAAAKPAAKKR